MNNNSNREFDRVTTNVMLASSLAAILLGTYLYARGDKQFSIFIGLWTPMILGLGTLVSTVKRLRPVPVARGSVKSVK